MQEGLFLYERGLDPYDGGIFYQVRTDIPCRLASSPKADPIHFQGTVVLAAILSSPIACDNPWPLDERHLVHLTGHPLGRLSV